MQIFEGSLDAKAITNAWYDEFKDKNCGALITFTGIVREEGGISALSFDIYEPILRKWLAGWEQKAKDLGAYVLFAHSRGDVPVHESGRRAHLRKRAKSGNKRGGAFRLNLLGSALIYAPSKFDGFLDKSFRLCFYSVLISKKCYQ